MQSITWSDLYLKESLLAAGSGVGEGCGKEAN